VSQPCWRLVRLSDTAPRGASTGGRQIPSGRGLEDHRLEERHLGGVALVVGALAFWGSQRGIPRQLRAAREAVEAGDRREHKRWLRDRADAVYVEMLTLALGVQDRIRPGLSAALGEADFFDFGREAPELLVPRGEDLGARLKMYGATEVFGAFEDRCLKAFAVGHATRVFHTAMQGANEVLRAGTMDAPTAERGLGAARDILQSKGEDLRLATNYLAKLSRSSVARSDREHGQFSAARSSGRPRFRQALHRRTVPNRTETLQAGRSTDAYAAPTRVRPCAPGLYHPRHRQSGMDSRSRPRLLGFPWPG
jgi:hypothetical protein